MSEKRDAPWTIAESTALPEEEKQRMLRAAKPGTWYDGWAPYCGQDQVRCSMPRMTPQPYGFRCPECGNMIAWDLTRLAESPLNNRPEGSTWTRDSRSPTCLIADAGDRHIAETLRDAGVLVLTPDDDLRHLGIGPLQLNLLQHAGRFVGIEPNSAYQLNCLQRLGHDMPTPIEHYRAPDEVDEYSRKGYRDVGPTGHPTHHRRSRKQQRQSRKRNRR